MTLEELVLSLEHKVEGKRLLIRTEHDDFEIAAVHDEGHALILDLGQKVIE